MRRLALALSLSLLLAFIPGTASAQFFLGGHAAYTDYQDGGLGGGIRAGWDLPVLPIDVLGVVEWFSPSCQEGNDGCSLWGGSLDVNARLPIPIVRPYLTGGWSFREFGLGGDGGDVSKNGLNLGGGLDVNLGIRIFADGRYEWLGEGYDGVVVRLGLNFNL